jgi:GT2 family glycosyltransferase
MGDRPSISLAVVTHNRVDLLRRCVENVVLRTSPATVEILIWDNASTDGTRNYLATLDDPRIRVVEHDRNIAMNARARAFAMLSSEYLVELDDDVVEAPTNWDEQLLRAFSALPLIGSLGADIAYDPDDVASQYLRYVREVRGEQPVIEVNGIRIREASPGGACTMTSRELYERVGGYGENARFPYWRPEIPYHRAIRKLGYTTAFLADLEVRHAGGPQHAEPTAEKRAYHRHELAVQARKNLVKRVLLALPFVAALNERHRWFDPPARPYEPSWPERHQTISGRPSGRR